ncbi:ribonucleotide-diphosphate reductase subunit beta, partial [bacterium]
ATEYSKGATKGDWQTVWSSFDQRRKAKGSDAANETGEVEGPDMFAKAGIAAE